MTAWLRRAFAATAPALRWWVLGGVASAIMAALQIASCSVKVNSNRLSVDVHRKLFELSEQLQTAELQRARVIQELKELNARLDALEDEDR